MTRLSGAAFFFFQIRHFCAGKLNLARSILERSIYTVRSHGSRSSVNSYNKVFQDVEKKLSEQCEHIEKIGSQGLHVATA